MRTPTAEERQQAIDVLKARLLEVTTGHTDEEAEAVATKLIDDAIAGGDAAAS